MFYQTCQLTAFKNGSVRVPIYIANLNSEADSAIVTRVFRFTMPPEADLLKTITAALVCLGGVSDTTGGVELSDVNNTRGDESLSFVFKVFGRSFSGFLDRYLPVGRIGLYLDSKGRTLRDNI